MTFKEISFDNDGKLRRLDKVENFQSNQEHEIFLNQTHIRYLYEPLINKDLHPPLDLGANFETYKNRDVFEEQLGQQRRWLVAKANTIPSASLKEV
uniref:Uncharacterized protein n=1 Tax=Acrobeloides nanus TaxID=290746 RepID=A0A914EAY5_9BILA